jgi:AraC-like DNA-binding protein
MLTSHQSTTGRDPDCERLRPRDKAKAWRNPHLRNTLFLRADYRSQRFDRHYHEEYAIGVIDSGCQAFVYDQSRRLDMPGGSVALIAPGIVHSGGPGAADGWRYRMLYPPRSVVAEIVADVFGPAAVPAFHRPVIWDDMLYQALAELHTESARGADAMAIETLVLVALRIAFQHHAGLAAPVTRSLHQPAMAQARDCLETRFAAAITLEELGRAAGLSRFQLLRQFKAAFGLPPHTYLRQIRVLRARQAILAGGALADTAVAVGFSDQAHMTRAFRRLLGYTPGALTRA